MGLGVHLRVLRGTALAPCRLWKAVVIQEGLQGGLANVTSEV